MGVEDPTSGCKVPIGREGLACPHGSDMPQNHGSYGNDVPEDILQDEASVSFGALICKVSEQNSQC